MNLRFRQGKWMILFGSLAGSLLLAVSYVEAAEAPVSKLDARQIVKERQAAFTLMQRNYKPLVEAVKNGSEIDTTSFSDYANNLYLLSTMAEEMFPVVSNVQAIQGNAKPEVWSENKEFTEMLQQYVLKTKKLSDEFSGLDKNKFKNLVIDIGGSCKSCHKKFKIK